MSSALLTEPWLWPLAVALGVYMVALVGVGVLVLYGLVAKIGDVRDDAQAEAFAGVSAGPARRVVALLVEAACQLFALGLQAGHALGLLPKYQGTGDGVPVVVLPGYTENAGTMWWLCRRLASAGFNVHGVSFPSTYSKLETNMKFLRERLAEIRTAHGGQPVAVVAHSMGGVITRAHTLDHEDHGVLTLVAFASPFRGANVHASERCFGSARAWFSCDRAAPSCVAIRPIGSCRCQRSR